jgi:hypothetical protein
MLQALIEDWQLFGILALFVIVLGLAIYGGIEQERDWETFAAANHCRVTGVVAATSTTGISTSGHVVVLTTPEKRTYTCDNNFTVTR